MGLFGGGGSSSMNPRRMTVDGYGKASLIGLIANTVQNVVGDVVNGWREGRVHDSAHEKLKQIRNGDRDVHLTATEANYLSQERKLQQKMHAESVKAAILAAHDAKVSGQSWQVQRSADAYYNSTVVEADGTVKYPSSTTIKQTQTEVDSKGNPIPAVDEKGQPLQKDGKPVYKTRVVEVPNPNILGIAGSTRDASQIMTEISRGEERENEGVLSRIMRNIGDALGGLFGGGSKRSEQISDAGGSLGGSVNLASAKPNGELLARVAAIGNSTVRGGQSVSTTEAVAPASTTVALAEKLVGNTLG